VTPFGGNKERVVTIGTASKGIIDRPFQHNAQVYRQLYAPNPFASETDENIQKYFQAIEAKSSRPNSTFIDQETVRAESPSADTVSLMEGVRQHRSMASIHEEDFNSTSKLPIAKSIPVMINSSRTAEDEVDNGKKKKKRSFFSFGKKKK